MSSEDEAVASGSDGAEEGAVDAEEDAEEMEEEAEEFFPVLGGSDFADAKPIAQPAPDWIRNARAVSGQLDGDKSPVGSCDWEAGLSEDARAKVAAEGVEFWFPVQKAVLPLLLAQHRRPDLLPPPDLCVSAPTGSGKTLAYAVPMVEALRERLVPHHRALVVLPQTDLAEQVGAVFRRLTAGTGLSVLLLSGQRDRAAETRALRAAQPADVVVATPGRLTDHLLDSIVAEDQGAGAYFKLPWLRYLVVDEADRVMRDERFQWLGLVERAVFGPKGAEPGPRHRVGMPSFHNLRRANDPPLQKLLFSATLSHDPEVLAEWSLHQPVLFAAKAPHREAEEGEAEAGGESLFAFPPQLEQRYAKVELARKPLAVFRLLQDHPEWTRVLCFAGSKEKSRRLRQLLVGLGLGTTSVAELSGDLHLSHRTKLLKRFANGAIRVLLASDVAGRGLDVADIDVVVNYEPARNGQAYAHRVGRTARAGKPGLALSLLGRGQELEEFKKLMTEGGWWAGLGKEKLAEASEEELAKYRDAMASLKDSLKDSQGRKGAKGRRNRKRKATQ